MTHWPLSFLQRWTADLYECIIYTESADWFDGSTRRWVWYCHTDKRYTVLISIIYWCLARMSNCVDVSKRIYFKRVFHQRLNGGLHISSVQFEISFVVDWSGFPCGNNGRQTEMNYQAPKWWPVKLEQWSKFTGYHFDHLHLQTCTFLFFYFSIYNKVSFIKALQ